MGASKPLTWHALAYRRGCLNHINMNAEKINEAAELYAAILHRIKDPKEADGFLVAVKDAIEAMASAGAIEHIGKMRLLLDYFEAAHVLHIVGRVAEHPDDFALKDHLVVILAPSYLNEHPDDIKEK